jgi:hypothetical protein
MKTRALVVALAAAGTALAAPVAAQETGTFTLTQNGTEVASEAFTRSDDMLRTEMTIPGQALIVTEATLAEDAIVDRLEIRVHPPNSPDADPLQSTAAEFANDSVRVEEPIGSEAIGQPAVRGTVPFLNPSPSHLEQMLRRARALGGSNVTVQIWVPSQGPGQVVPAQVAFNDNGTATLTLGSVAFELETDDEGRLLGGEVPSQGLTIERQ